MFKALIGFAGGYLHQDWHLDADDPIDLARQFARDEEPALVAQAVGELALLLRAGTTDDDLATRLLELGAYLDLRGITTDVRGWLATAQQAILDELLERAKAT